MKKLVLFCFVLLCLSGCADNVSYEIAGKVDEVGFLYGLWHGMIAPIAWVISWFSDDVAIYAVYNNGIWYNFGFLIGIGAFVSSGSSRRSK